MDHPTLKWALFCAVLVPLFLRMPTDPLIMTAAQVALCLGMVALADRIERASGRH